MASASLRCRTVLVLALAAALLGLPVQAAIPLLEGPSGVPTLAPLLNRVTPAVVNISVLSEAPMEDNPLFRDPFFRRFFDLPEEPPARPRMSAGSGVIVNAEKGYVITNHHVVENGKEILVTLKDRRQFAAELVGADAGTDIALLKIEAEDLIALPFGDSDALQVGDFVIAIGNPFGLGQTVTSGIVSALGRTGLSPEGYEDFIQTDAPINPGNSGGALISLTGELIGVNSAIIAPAGGNVGIGFAVPTQLVEPVMKQLIAYGEVRRGRLGIVIQDLTPDIAKAMGLPQQRGAVVTQVEDGSPAESAGIRAGDVVVELNQRPVEGSSDLRNRVGLIPPGETVALTLIRDGQRVTLRARVGKVEEAAAVPAEMPAKLEGARFRELDVATKRGRSIMGVLVESVAPGSPAWRRGLRQGDIIVAVNRRIVSDLNELSKALKEAGRVIALNIIRGDAALFILIQ
jgi:Do/DeqQ family serine protease